MLNPHGKANFRRSLAIGAALYIAAAVLTWATDEVDASWGQRAARLGALGPVIGGLSTWLIGQVGRARGEARALLAQGATPHQLERGAVLAGWALAVFGLMLALGPWSNQQSLFPALESGRNWRALADGSLIDPLGARYSAAAGLVPAAAEALPPSVPYTLATLGFLLPLVIAVPLWVVNLRPGPRALLAAGGALLVSAGLALWLLHGVAAGRVPWPALIAAPLPLLLEYRLRNPRAA